MEKNSYSLQRNTGLIGRYVIQEVLGQGGFGITYLGIDKLYVEKRGKTFLLQIEEQTADQCGDTVPGDCRKTIKDTT